MSGRNRDRDPGDESDAAREQDIVGAVLPPFAPTHASHKLVEAHPIAAAEFRADGSGKIALAGGRIVEVPAGFTARGTPAEHDMLVRYAPTAEHPNGYLSHSPRKVFEGGHVTVSPLQHHKSFEGGGRGLSFGQAIEQMKAGAAVARDGWNGKGMFVVLMPALFLPPFNTQDTARKVNDRTAKWIGEDQPLDCQPYFAMWTAAKQWQPGWLASQADMLAEDWCVVRPAVAMAA